MLVENFEIVGISPRFLKAVEFGRNVAVTKHPVLITGEAGTGKRRLSEYIHGQSSRAKNILIVIDCSKKHDIVEKEILGFRDEDGRFHKGALERGNGGTVVLANIEGLEENFQKKLCMIMNELSDYELDIRLIATTSKNLSKYVGTGRFYRALHSFFSETQINMPALRDRKEDFTPIVRFFCHRYKLKNNCPEKVINITEDAIGKIASFYWTHNYAELENVIAKSIEHSDSGIIDKAAIEVGERKSSPTSSSDSEDGAFKLMSLKEAEKLLIKKALIHTSENRTQAAKILGVSIRTLRNKINEYRNDGSQFFLSLR